MSDDESPLMEVRNYAMAISLRFTKGNRDLSEDIASDVMLDIECPPPFKKQPPRPFLLSDTMCKRWIKWRVLDRMKNKRYRTHLSLHDLEETER